MVKEADAARGRTTLITRIVPCDLDWLLLLLAVAGLCAAWSAGTTPPRIKFDHHRTCRYNWRKSIPGNCQRSSFTELDRHYRNADECDRTAVLLLTAGLRSDHRPAAGQPAANACHSGQAKVRARPNAALDVARRVCLTSFRSWATRRARWHCQRSSPRLCAAPSTLPRRTPTTAPEPGSGKSYVADIMSEPSPPAKPCPVLSAGTDEEELEKRLERRSAGGRAVHFHRQRERA